MSYVDTPLRQLRSARTVALPPTASAAENPALQAADGKSDSDGRHEYERGHDRGIAVACPPRRCRHPGEAPAPKPRSHQREKRIDASAARCLRGEAVTLPPRSRLKTAAARAGRWEAVASAVDDAGSVRRLRGPDSGQTQGARNRLQSHLIGWPRPSCGEGPPYPTPPASRGRGRRSRREVGDRARGGPSDERKRPPQARPRHS
jgi:hypothetical protein